ncbi:MAG: carbohydrate ABC transporter permease [Actinomycetes bacterium]
MAGGLAVPRLDEHRRASPARTPRARRARVREALAGWVFVSPAVLLLIVFLIIPVGMAVWVSLTGWNGFGSPFSSAAPFVGGKNYASLFSGGGLVEQTFMTSIRNTLYYTIIVVPSQTALALLLALFVNSRLLKGKGFFRTAFYFPSVTSSVAVSVIFLFIFTSGGAVNTALRAIGINGPNWFNDPHGLLHIVLGDLHLVNLASPPALLANHGLFTLSWWDWLSGPSVALCTVILLVVWTTSGTFMLMYLAALQNLPSGVEEASLIDGAGPLQRLRYMTIPMLKSTTFLIVTLGLIGTWQVFDQVFIMTQGGPANTTLSPAYIAYTSGFDDHQWGPAAAMSFILFAIIIVFTLVQRWLMRDRDRVRRRSRVRRRARSAVGP